MTKLAVIGAGQLARMMQQPAIALGLELVLLAEADDASAARVIVDSTVGDHTVVEDLQKVSSEVAAVTFDHEHVPTEHLEALEAAGIATRPGPGALVYAQDKLRMRRAMADWGLPNPRWCAFDSADDLADMTFPAVVKTPRGGYDGKGVWIVADVDEALALRGQIGQTLLCEEKVDFRRELSAQIARRPGGEVMVYPVVESRQRDGVCFEVIAPAPDLDDDALAEAESIAATVAERAGVVGMLAVELFETSDGRILINELAMRPHNTGHWTIDGAVTSQFENHLRAVADLPLGSSEPIREWSVMVNILGDQIDPLESVLPEVLSDPGVKVHLYGKGVKPGRKVGHVTVSGDDLDAVRTRALRAAEIFMKGLQS